MSLGTPTITYSTRLPNLSGAEFLRLSDALFTYRIYPRNRLRAIVCSPSGRILDNGLIVQRVRIPPFTFEAAVVVTEVIIRDDLHGFTYETIDGHPECGSATFRLWRDDNDTVFEISTRSVPGSIAARLAAPAALWFQHQLNSQAVSSFASQLTDSEWR